jgi:hypothetical protein
MSSRYKSFTYEITTNPEYLNDKFGITPELFRQFETLHHKALKGGDKIIERLILLIEKYLRSLTLKITCQLPIKIQARWRKPLRLTAGFSKSILITCLANYI